MENILENAVGPNENLASKDSGEMHKIGNLRGECTWINVKIRDEVTATRIQSERQTAEIKSAKTCKPINRALKLQKKSL